MQDLLKVCMFIKLLCLTVCYCVEYGNLDIL